MFSIIVFFHVSVEAAFAQSSPDKTSINGVVFGIFLRIKNNDICMPEYVFESNTQKCVAAKTINLLIAHPCSPWDKEELPNYICDLAENKQYVLIQNTCFSTTKSAQTFPPFPLLDKSVDNNYCLPPNAQVSPTPERIRIPLNIYLDISPRPTPTPTPSSLPRSADKPFEIGLANDPNPSEAVTIGSRWARLNFIDFQANTRYYDYLVNTYTEKNIKIMGLISNEVDGKADKDLGPEGFTNHYAELAGEIIERYRNRIKVYELYNEPNEHDLDATTYAKYQAAIYKKVKIDKGIKDVTILSGALFAFANPESSSDAVDYLMDFYNNGIRNVDVNQKTKVKGPLNWENIKKKTGSYPLDGIAYHLYVAQWSTNSKEIKDWYYLYLDNVNKALIEQNDYPKPIYITEFSFQLGPNGEEGQAKSLEIAFNLLKEYRFKSAQPVKAAFWYRLDIASDPPFGLMDGNKKTPGYYKFQAIGKENL